MLICDKAAVSVADDMLKAGQNVKGKKDLDCVIWQESNLAEKEVLRCAVHICFISRFQKKWIVRIPTYPSCPNDLVKDDRNQVKVKYNATDLYCGIKVNANGFFSFKSVFSLVF